MQVYTEPLCRRYYGSVIGEAALFRFFAYLSAIVLALVVAFATGGFWVKLTPDNVQATVSYTQDAILIFEVCAEYSGGLWSGAGKVSHSVALASEGCGAANPSLAREGVPSMRHLPRRNSVAPFAANYRVRRLGKLRSGAHHLC